MKKNKPDIEIDIREFNPHGNNDKAWLFLKHTKKEESNYDFRWTIEYRKKDKWFGMVALFPATHEKALDKIKVEVELAKQAIKIIKHSLSPSKRGK